MLESVAKGITNDDIQAEIEDLQQQNGFLTAEVQELMNDRERWARFFSFLLTHREPFCSPHCNPILDRSLLHCSREMQLKKLQDKTKKYETAGESLLREMVLLLNFNLFKISVNRNTILRCY